MSGIVVHEFSSINIWTNSSIKLGCIYESSCLSDRSLLVLL